MPRLLINGLHLNVERHGSGNPLLLLHGFTGSAEAWQGVLPVLAERHQVVVVDLVGHGRSDAPEDLTHYRMPTVVNDLDLLLDALALPAVHLLGYSMGGRTALQFAAAHPDRVMALVLESASPGMADPVERQSRQASDAALAERIERDGLAAFVAEWERLPLFRSQERLPEAVRATQHAQRLLNEPRGLANSLRGMGAGAQVPLWEALPHLATPTLLLAGAEDAKYCAVAQAMAARMPRASVAMIPSAGHTTHLEQPEQFISYVLAFLAGWTGEGRPSPWLRHLSPERGRGVGERA